MIRTAIASIAMLVAGWVAASWLTHGFQVWTDEGARRLEVALTPVAVPPVAIEGLGVNVPDLAALLAQPGRVTIVDFIYTHCTTVCLALGSSFQQLQADLQRDTDAAGNDGVRLLSISFDGARDDPAALQAWGQRFNVDATLWSLVRVPDTASEQALLRQLGVVVVPDQRGDYEHNAALLVLDAQGRMVRIFDLEERQLALNYARHLAQKERARGDSS